ncbi:TonB-dependent receptor plug domain-containing protein [Endozoicomonas gorgoniicola]|uniref:TonB-dependent receptor plug domain-containing protein n=1 Tax=Endozoicomonas gorgoniicola TaxID=1234144 RepID=A0ABT3N3S5_9GAMM|nr:TonB-dependent receptor plug domain-containing protein [Endozoicomonas gorgoniicola]MCW7556282.1 TonB-dependent receptor plug domain-containing protein [Endozoicomonas gorgoniicola]
MKKALSGAITFALVSGAYADSVASNNSSQEVIVREKADAGLTSQHTLTAQDIKKRPTGDGNLTDLLKSNPAVKFSNSSHSGLNQGEIKPADISIHGSTAYQNAFLLDGLSINNDLDPVDSDDVTTARHASDEQGMYIDSRLIDSLTVYDSNIPVEFGGFTGGVVDATSRSWQGDTRGSVYIRQTKSSWNQTHVDRNLKFNSENNDLSNPARFQPEYSKMNYGLNYEMGITDDLGVVLSLSRRESKIPMVNVPGKHLSIDGQGGLMIADVAGGTKNQKRVSNNAFTKFTWYATPRTIVNWSLAYSGYEADMFMNGVANSDYSDLHNAYSTNLEVDHSFDRSTLVLSLGYNHMVDKRDSEVDYWVQLDDYSDWRNPTSYASGGIGDLKSVQKTTSAKAKLVFDPVQWGGLTHNVTVGSEYNYTDAAFIRDQNYYRNTYRGTQDFQSLGRVTVFQEGTYKTTHSSYAVYAQNEMQWGNVTVRPGVRVDHDNFVNRTNVAPRLSSSWNVFGDGNTLLTAGANRYYGRSMLTYALYEGQNGGLGHCYFGCNANSPDNDWNFIKDYEGMDQLKTPYNDEFTAGIQQLWGNSIWQLNYVHRKGRDEVKSHYKYPDSKDPGKARIRKFDNSGQSENDSITLSVSNRSPLRLMGAEHSAKLSLTWQESKSNTPKERGYSSFESGSSVDASKVWYDGKIIAAKDLPSTDFNSPLVLNLELIHEIRPYNLTWYNLFHWNASRNQATRHGNELAVDPETGNKVAKYDKVRFASTFTWDTKWQWKPASGKGMHASFEVYNVLNRKNAVDAFIYKNTVYRNFAPGRQFWVQLGYDF